MRKIIAVILGWMFLCVFAGPVCADTVSSGASVINNNLSIQTGFYKDMDIIVSLALPEYEDIPDIKLNVVDLVNRVKPLKDMLRLI